MSSGRSSEDREDDNDEVENAAALAAASMTSLIYQDLLTAMRDDASTNGSGRGGRHRHPHPGQQPMSLQGSRMGSYGRIDGSRKSALQNEIRSVEVTFLHSRLISFQPLGLKFHHHKLKFSFNFFRLRNVKESRNKKLLKNLNLPLFPFPGQSSPTSSTASSPPAPTASATRFIPSGSWASPPGRDPSPSQDSRPPSPPPWPGTNFI